MANVRSPETYVGNARAQGFAGDVLVKNKAHRYETPAQLAVNQWGLSGRWHVGAHHATLLSDSGSITYHFRGRDLHLVMAPSEEGEPFCFRVTIDGVDHGKRVLARGPHPGPVGRKRVIFLLPPMAVPARKSSPRLQASRKRQSTVTIL